MSDIITSISTARYKYSAENNGRAPLEIVMDLHTADLLRIAVNKMLPKRGDRIDKAEKVFGGRIFGLEIKRWPRNEKGFAVR